MKQNSTRRGFTLIELLVVVIIIAILAAIALPQYQKAVMKARAAEIQTFIAHVEKAMDLYVLENGYPSSGTKDISWGEMGIDVSSYCDSVGDSFHYYKCTAKNFSAEAPYVSSVNWAWSLTPSSSAFGGSSWLVIRANKNGTKEKTCSPLGSLKAKPLCDALKASDPSWVVDLSSAG